VRAICPRAWSWHTEGVRGRAAAGAALLATATVAVLGCGCGYRGWSSADTIGQAVASAAIMVDAEQTRRGMQRDGIGESNPLAAAVGNPLLYGATFVLLNAAVAVLLRDRARSVWQGLTIGSEAMAIYNNAMVLRE